MPFALRTTWLLLALIATLWGCVENEPSSARRWTEFAVHLDELVTFDQCVLSQNQLSIEGEFDMLAELYDVTDGAERLLGQHHGLIVEAGMETVVLDRTFSGWAPNGVGAAVRLDVSLQEIDRGTVEGPAKTSSFFDWDERARCWQPRDDDQGCAATGDVLEGSVSLVSMSSANVAHCRAVVFWAVEPQLFELPAPAGDEIVGVHQGEFGLQLESLLEEPDGWMGIATCNGLFTLVADPSAPDDIVGEGACGAGPTRKTLEVRADDLGDGRFEGDFRASTGSVTDDFQAMGTREGHTLRTSFVVPTMLGDDIEAR